LTFALSLGYFIGIWVWNPYNKAIQLHNNFLRLNHGTVLLFEIYFLIINRVGKIPDKVYVTFMWIG